MKLNQVTNEYATNNGVSHGRFKVANNSVMKQILSDFLYSDKIKAVIRELSTNAYESHLDAGWPDKPFQINLPTNLNPQFSIRDFGTGLDKEKLESLYCTYGLSTKRTSDEYTGCFGIGSKSPFAYTDLFTVVSYYNGMKYVVVNSKDSRSEFCYDILAEVETTEPNGIEIIFDVQKGDINNFLNKATEVFKFFTVPPVCNLNLNLKKPVFVKSGDGWDILSYSRSYYGSEKNYAIMGQVAYVIDAEHFKDRSKNILESCQLYINIDMSNEDEKLSIAPSREALQYNKHTIEVIDRKLNNLYGQVKKETEQEIVNCKSKWEARLLVSKYLASNSYVSRLLNGTIEFRGENIENKTYVHANYKDASGVLRMIEPVKYEYQKYNNSVVEAKKHVDFKIEEKARFAIYEQGGYAAAKRYAEQNPTLAIYVVHPDHKDYLIDTVGILESDLLYTSKFPACVRQARTKSVGNKIQAYRFKKQGKSWYHDSAKNYWVNQEIDLDAETGYYALIKGFYITPHSTSPSIINEHVDNINVVGILTNREDKIKNNKNWKPLAEYFKIQLDNIVKANPGIGQYFAVSYDTTLDSLLPIRNLLKRHTDLTKAMDVLIKANQYKELIANLKSLKSIYKSLSGNDYVVHHVKLDINFSLAKYPLLHLISTHNYKDSAVVDYINEIDAKP